MIAVPKFQCIHFHLNMDLVAVIIIGSGLLIGKVNGHQNETNCPFEDAYISGSGNYSSGSYDNARVDIGSRNCSFSLQVRDPLICPNDVMRLSSADVIAIPVSWMPPAYEYPTELRSSHQPGDMFIVNRTTTVWYSAFGNNSCSFTVTVTYPDCPPDMAISSSEAKAAVNWTEPALVDNYTATANRSQEPIGVVGVHTAMYTFRQTSCGTTCSPNATCSFNIVVYNEDPPEILDCPRDVNITTTNLESLPWYIPPMTKNESSGDVLVSASVDTDYQYREGENRIRFTFMNTYTNLTAVCSFTVTVALEDECESGLDMTLVIVAAVGYILWVVTLLVICCRAFYRSTGCCSVEESSSAFALNPPPQIPPPKPEKGKSESDGIYHDPRKEAPHSYDKAAASNRCHPDEWAKPSSDSEGEGSDTGGGAFGRKEVNGPKGVDEESSGRSYIPDSPTRVPFPNPSAQITNVDDQGPNGSSPYTANRPRLWSKSDVDGNDPYTTNSSRERGKSDVDVSDPYTTNRSRKWSKSDVDGSDPYTINRSRTWSKSNVDDHDPYTTNPPHGRRKSGLDDSDAYTTNRPRRGSKSGVSDNREVGKAQLDSVEMNFEGTYDDIAQPV